ncbi:MAG: hypothetical protein IH614_01855 [Desulfuromonadales bacterium]|nr:hypothetical protein [Desulfuromonadales bacterium]
MGDRYRGTWAVAALALALFAAPALGAEYRLESRTLLQAFERDTLERRDAAVVPAYQYLQLELREKRQPELSFHLYGWGRIDLADNGYFDDQTGGELIHAYLRYLRRDGRLDLRLGRFYVFEGVANEGVDGVSARFPLRPDLSLSLYGGLPVSLAEDAGRSGDRIVGGRLAWQPAPGRQLGLSYKRLASHGDRDEERAGFDLAWPLPAGLTLLGTSVRDLVNDRWGEHLYELRVAAGPFQLRPFYQYYDYRGFLSQRDSSSPPFRFLATLDNAANIVGTEAYWFPDAQLEIGMRAKYYDYRMRFDEATYLAGLFTWKWQIFNQFGGEIGRMAGDWDRNRYWLGRGFVYLQMARNFVSADLVYVRYDRPIFHEDHSLYLSMGGGRRFLDDRLRLKLAVAYSSDPVFDNDYRCTVIGEYLFP